MLVITRVRMFITLGPRTLCTTNLPTYASIYAVCNTVIWAKMLEYALKID